MLYSMRCGPASSHALALRICSRQESPRFAPRIAGRLELTDIAEEMPFEMRVLEAALDFVRPDAPFVR